MGPSMLRLTLNPMFNLSLIGWGPSKSDDFPLNAGTPRSFRTCPGSAVFSATSFPVVDHVFFWVLFPALVRPSVQSLTVPPLPRRKIAMAETTQEAEAPRWCHGQGSAGAQGVRFSFAWTPPTKESSREARFGGNPLFLDSVFVCGAVMNARSTASGCCVSKGISHLLAYRFSLAVAKSSASGAWLRASPWPRRLAWRWRPSASRRRRRREHESLGCGGTCGHQMALYFNGMLAACSPGSKTCVPNKG